jgi:predicted MPP superfamily phosphohydrolase
VRRATAAAALALAAYAGWIEPRRLVVRESRLELPHWPRELAGLRAGFMTDFHGGAPHAGPATIERWVARMNEQRPDIVLLGGDFVDAHFLFGGRMDPEPIAERLAALNAPHGAVAVLGNHDWRQFGARMWNALTAAGIHVLENDAVAIPDRRATFHVAGLADLRSRRPDTVAALEHVPAGAPVLMLAHDPDLFPLVPERVALTVAGHTHAGQIALPYIRRPFIPSYYGERYARGHIVEDGRHLVVGAGLGTSGAPVRLLAPPELLVLELHPCAHS